MEKEKSKRDAKIDAHHSFTLVLRRGRSQEMDRRNQVGKVNFASNLYFRKFNRRRKFMQFPFLSPMAYCDERRP